MNNDLIRVPEVGEIVNYLMADESVRQAKVLEVVSPEEGGLKLELYHPNGSSCIVEWSWPGTGKETYHWFL